MEQETVQRGRHQRIESEGQGAENREWREQLMLTLRVLSGAGTGLPYLLIFDGSKSETTAPVVLLPQAKTARRVLNSLPSRQITRSFQWLQLLLLFTRQDG